MTPQAPIRPRLVFCGVGALGSQAVLLSRNLPARLELVDGDRVETKNLLSQAYVRQSVGKLKAQALALQLRNFYRVEAEAFSVRLTETNARQFLEGVTLAVDCFDNAASRRLLSDKSRALGVPLLHGALAGDGSFGIVRWDEHFEADEEDTPGQPTCEGGEHLPLITLAAATLARTIQDFLRSGERRDSMISLTGVQGLSPAGV